MKVIDLIYPFYERRLLKEITNLPRPKHVGVILDGNRRWAKEQGSTTIDGHKVGASRIERFLDWCEESKIEHVTLWLLSTENLSRENKELTHLFELIENTVQDLGATNKWRIVPVGALDLLPASTGTALKQVAENTRDIKTMTVNIAVGYGGRREVVDAIRTVLTDHAQLGTTLEELAETIDIEHISQNLYTKGQPDPDLVIRTSGEQRLSGFLLWQSAHAEFYFCEAFWPDFRKVDFLRALRDFGSRSRRFGA
jgi:short-chain Z-isoprenyl diphosphate synthase